MMMNMFMVRRTEEEGWTKIRTTYAMVTGDGLATWTAKHGLPRESQAWKHSIVCSRPTSTALLVLVRTKEFAYRYLSDT